MHCHRTSHTHRNTHTHTYAHTSTRQARTRTLTHSTMPCYPLVCSQLPFTQLQEAVGAVNALARRVWGWSGIAMVWINALGIILCIGSVVWFVGAAAAVVVVADSSFNFGDVALGFFGGYIAGCICLAFGYYGLPPKHRRTWDTLRTLVQEEIDAEYGNEWVIIMARESYTGSVLQPVSSRERVLHIEMLPAPRVMGEAQPESPEYSSASATAQRSADSRAWEDPELEPRTAVVQVLHGVTATHASSPEHTARPAPGRLQIPEPSGVQPSNISPRRLGAWGSTLLSAPTPITGAVAMDLQLQVEPEQQPAPRPGHMDPRDVGPEQVVVLVPDFNVSGSVPMSVMKSRSLSEAPASRAGTPTHSATMPSPGGRRVRFADTRYAAYTPGASTTEQRSGVLRADAEVEVFMDGHAAPARQCTELQIDAQSSNAAPHFLHLSTKSKNSSMPTPPLPPFHCRATPEHAPADSQRT